MREQGAGGGAGDRTGARMSAAADLLAMDVPWPTWTNPSISLFHGTIITSANNLSVSGVDITKGRSLTDFGRGFYTTTDEATARTWSERIARRRGGEPTVVSLSLARTALGRLNSVAFVRGSLDARDYWSFVAHCRSGLSHQPATGSFYDVVYGPVAKTWAGSRSSSTWADYDQISFHTRIAQDMLNDRSLCALEVLDD